MSTAATLTAPVHRYSVVNWLTCIVMVIFHVGAVAALFHFSWTLLAVSVALYWIAVGFGISLGYHRLHTHRLQGPSGSSTSSPSAARSRSRAAQSSGWRPTASTTSIPIPTLTRTRPKHGGFWAHIGWMLFGEAHHNKTDVLAKYAPDLGRRPVLPLCSTRITGCR